MHRPTAAIAVLLCLVVSAPAQDPPPAEKVPAGWKEFTPKDNAFTVFIPQKTTRQSERERTSTVKGQRLKLTLLHVEMASGVSYDVEKLTLPVAFAKLKRKELEEMFRDMIITESKGKVKDEEEVKLGPIAGKGFTMDIPNGLAHARVFAAGGGRVYLLYAKGPKAEIEKADTLTFLNSCRLGKAPAAPEAGGGDVAGPSTVPTTPTTPGATAVDRKWGEVRGGGGDPQFKDAAPKDGVLAGLEVGLGKFGNNDVVRAVRPIYRVGDKDSLGEQRGTELTRIVKVVAKPGYAVSALTVKTGLGVDGLSVTFMKIADGKLNAADAYESDWVGGKGGGQPVKIGGDGTLVLGLIGKTNNKDLTGLGLPSGVVKVVQGTKTKILGGAFDPEFEEGAPEGGLLVGLEIGLNQPGTGVVKSMRPVYRVGDQDSLGEQHGAATKNLVKVIAKQGYAVGAITVKAGLGVDGLSVTFMKVADGKLDAADSYESDWVGGKGGGGPTKLGGTGTPVIGLIGKSNAREFTGIGIVSQK